MIELRSEMIRCMVLAQSLYIQSKIQLPWISRSCSCPLHPFPIIFNTDVLDHKEFGSILSGRSQWLCPAHRFIGWSPQSARQRNCTMQSWALRIKFQTECKFTRANFRDWSTWARPQGKGSEFLVAFPNESMVVGTELKWTRSLRAQQT